MTIPVKMHKSRKDFLIYKINILEASISSLNKSSQCGVTDLTMKKTALQRELNEILEKEEMQKKIDFLENKFWENNRTIDLKK